MKKLFKVFLYILAFLVPSAGTGVIGFLSSMDVAMANSSVPAIPAGLSPTDIPATYDLSRPIAVILLGDDLTEVTDFLGPYELLSASQIYNVYVLAPQHRLTTLTRGLEVMPDMSLSEFDRQFGRDPDLIVTPNIPYIKEVNNQPLVSWVKNHAGANTTLFSWCTGAAVLAETGLLDGKAATAHWGDIDRLEKDYPKVHWVRGLRYVDEANNIVTSGGLLSGIDATLHVISKVKGTEFSQTLARELNYPSYQFVENPNVQQYKTGPGDLITILNAAYKWEKNEYGVLLYDGIGELELASVMDTYSASFTTRIQTIALRREFITTKNGLHLLPRWDLSNPPKVERLLIPGVTALKGNVVPDRVLDWAMAKAIPTNFVHFNNPARFAFDAPLEDLASHQNNVTAEFAKKRLEYRADITRFEGTGWPFLLMLRPLLLGLVGVIMLFGISRLVTKRPKYTDNSQGNPQQELTLSRRI